MGKGQDKIAEMGLGRRDFLKVMGAGAIAGSLALDSSVQKSDCSNRPQRALQAGHCSLHHRASRILWLTGA